MIPDVTPRVQLMGAIFVFFLFIGVFIYMKVMEKNEGNGPDIKELSRDEALKSHVLIKSDGTIVTKDDILRAYNSTPVQTGMTAWNLSGCLGVVSSAVVGPAGPLLLVTNLSSCQDGVASVLQAMGITITGHKPFLSVSDTIIPNLKDAWDSFTGNRDLSYKGCTETKGFWWCMWNCGFKGEPKNCKCC